MKTEAEIRAKIAEYQAEAQHWASRTETYKQADNQGMVGMCESMEAALINRVRVMEWILDDPEGEIVNSENHED